MVEPWGMSREELAAELRRCEFLMRRAQARYHAVLAEMASRGTQAEYGYSSLETLQVDLLHIGRREAKRRSARAMHSHDAVAGALAAGAISVEHVDEIARVLAEVPVDQVAALEKTLVAVATECEPRQVRRVGQHALDLLDPDGPEPAVQELARPEREFYLQKRRDGRYGLTGILDQESGHALERMLSPLSKPRPAADGERDPRSPHQRRGDGFAELVGLLQRAVDRPSEGGERPTVVVTIPLDTLGADGGTRVVGDRPALADGTPITIAQARRIACDAQVIPAVLGSAGEILDLGRTQRLVSTAQRRTLNLRDKGCVKCGRPDKWCHAHHITPWSEGGDTDVGNLCLLCSECHRLVHHAGWTVVINDKGRPECTPPDWIDPRQRARLNVNLAA